jgi:hypothetical protein
MGRSPFAGEIRKQHRWFGWASKPARTVNLRAPRPAFTGDRPGGSRRVVMGPMAQTLRPIS